MGYFELPNASVRYLSIEDLLSAARATEVLSKTDQYELNSLKKNFPERYILNPELDDSELFSQKGWLNTFYRDLYSLFLLKTDNFFLKIDPVLNIALGDDRHDSKLIFQNTRGIKIRGILDNKVFFYSSIYENQQRFLSYIEDEIARSNAIPGQGFYKPYQSGIINSLNGWDFLNAEAYAGINISNSIDLRLGQGRHFIGNGIRSLLLSDYANNYFYLQFNTRIWKLHYQNTFAELSATSSRDNPGNTLLPKKYMATHYLDFQVHPNLSLGLFETIVFSRENHFEFHYLNPVILYRSVEQLLDSPDNAILGFNIQWIPKKKYQIYGQLLIDELKTSETFAGDGWWGNKVAYQIGLKKYDLFQIGNLDFQLEYNTVRPFTYAHRSDNNSAIPTASYSHFNQPLAHPYGANFREFIVSFNYRFNEKFAFNASIVNSNYGDSNLENVGKDILANYENRSSDYNNFTGQGDQNDIFGLQINTNYEFLPNGFIDLTFLHRRRSLESNPIDKNDYLGIGIRVNAFHSNLFF